MVTKVKNWSTGTGSATIQYEGQGDGFITITSGPNSVYESRSMQIAIETTDGSGIQRIVNINQAAKQRIDLSAAVVTAANQTYSGNAKTPTPIVSLNGSTVPSTGYDVSYSNNTNAGTATITIIGKGEYTGTATGTFTINKASRTLSFADTYMVLNTSSTGTKTATPSAGGGDGAITYSIANTTYATINSSTGAVTSKTSDGSVTVTATIAEGTNYLSATATYTLYVFATTHNYSYTGSVKNVTLPPGTYQLQCWGAQGGTCSAGYSGGKGGYSVGQLSIASALAIQVLVGGQGGSSSGGYNGGGSSTGYSEYNSGNTNGYSYMAGGGGASDIRLSSGTLLSRMIVAGGGSGGAYTYRRETTVVTDWVADDSREVYGLDQGSRVLAYPTDLTPLSKSDYYGKTLKIDSSQLPAGGTVELTLLNDWSEVGWPKYSLGEEFTLPSNVTYDSFRYYVIYPSGTSISSGSYLNLYEQTTYESYNEYSDYQYGYAGGGTSGIGYSASYYGKQNAAGSNGSFGQGANQSISGYRHCSGAGGGGWYGGGGGKYSDSDMNTVHLSGGGSGFVNTAASAGNRPSGYTGLELDSGTTYDGNTSFPATGGGNETGHSGNGYARITRIS